MIELTLPDMSCGHCVQTVTRTVQRLDAQATLEIELAAHRVRIDSSLPAASFIEALAEAGYRAA
jgi:copper chaperone